MDCGKKTLIFLTLCALAGANSFQKIKNNVQILISVPSTHLRDTEITSAGFTASANHPFMYTVVAEKNQTQCLSSTDPLCTSLIKEPSLDVLLTSSSSNGKSFSYTRSINESLQLVINVDHEVRVSPQIVSGNGTTVTLDFMYDRSNTSRDSLSASTKPEKFSLNATFTTTIKTEDTNGSNGQSTLRCGPLSALILLALLPVLLLK